MNTGPETAVDIFEKLGRTVAEYHGGLTTVGENQDARAQFLLIKLGENGLRLTLEAE